MAVLQISQIQVRKGLLQDLGQLAGGEFGWAVDKLRLFIGNGNLDEGSPYIGNTEILTEHSLRTNGLATFTYRFRGLLGGYDAQSGPTVLSPILRSLQDKLDDFINVKDFGAVGDGFTDDLDAIQRAIDEVYNRLGAFTNYPTRRHVNFYPGVYVVYGELRLPPFTYLNGIGEGAVIIRQMSPASTCLIKSTTSTGIFDERINSNGMAPGPIAINNITFENTFDRDIALFESASDVSLFRCRFIGNLTTPTTSSISNGVAFKSTYLAAKSIRVVECDFSGSSTNLLLSSNIGLSDVSVTRCTFSNSYYGVFFTTFTAAPPHASTRITDSVFDRIAKEGIRVEPHLKGVLTSTNTFLNVGRGQLATANPISSVITFSGNASHSIADVFFRNDKDDYYFPTVFHGATEIISTDPNSQIKFGNSHQTIGRSITVTNNTSANVALSPRFKQGRVFYSVQRNNKFRVGQIKFAVDPGSNSCEWRESYTEKDSVGVITNMRYEVVDGLTRPVVEFRADDRGTASVITYDVKSDFNPAYLNALPEATYPPPTTAPPPLANIDLYFSPANINVNIAFSTNSISTLGNTYLFAANGTPMAFYPVIMSVNTAPASSNVFISPVSFNIMSGEQREVFFPIRFESPANDTTSTEFVYTIDAVSGTEKATFTYTQNRIASTTTTTTTAAPGPTTTSTTTTAAPGTTTTTTAAPGTTTTTTSTTTTAAPGTTTTTTSTTTTAAPGTTTTTTAAPGTTTTTTSTTTTAAPGTTTTTTTLSANPYASNLSFGQIDTGTVDGGGAPIYAQGYKFVDISNVTRVVINSKSEPSLTNDPYDTWSSTVETIYDSNVDAPLPASGQIRTFSGAHSGEAFFTGGTGKVGYRITVYHTTNPTWTSSATSSPTDYIRLGGTFGGGS